MGSFKRRERHLKSCQENRPHDNGAGEARWLPGTRRELATGGDQREGSREAAWSATHDVPKMGEG